jgi:hypothetical protein
MVGGPKGEAMAERVLFIGWDAPVRGREERSLEVFNEALGICDRMRQDGRIEGFEVVLFAPNQELGGHLQLFGSAEQIAAVRNDADFQRNTIDAELAVDGLRHLEGYTGDGVAGQMALYQEALDRMPQLA